MRVLAEDETVRTKKLKDVGNQEVKDTTYHICFVIVVCWCMVTERCWFITVV
jgi:hypothetical protein